MRQPELAQRGLAALSEGFCPVCLLSDQHEPLEQILEPTGRIHEMLAEEITVEGDIAGGINFTGSPIRVQPLEVWLLCRTCNHRYRFLKDPLRVRERAPVPSGIEDGAIWLIDGRVWAVLEDGTTVEMEADAKGCAKQLEGTRWFETEWWPA